MSQLPAITEQGGRLVSVEDLQQQLAVVRTADEGKTVENTARRMRDAILLAGKGVEKANEFAEVACEAGATIGEILDPSTVPGQRRDLTSHGRERFDGPSSTATNYRNMARVPLKKRRLFYGEMKKIQEIISKSGLLRFGKGQPANYSSESNEWYTPTIYIEAAIEVLGKIELDPASSHDANKRVGADKIFTAEDSPLERDWTGTVFMNPPYGTTRGESVAALFCNKATAEYEAGHVSEAILLVNSVHSQNWQRPLYDYVVCFVDHRIKFISDAGGANENPTFQNLFIYLGQNKKKFSAVFSRLGYVMERIHV